MKRILLVLIFGICSLPLTAAQQQEEDQKKLNQLSADLGRLREQGLPMSDELVEARLREKNKKHAAAIAQMAEQQTVDAKKEAEKRKKLFLEKLTQRAQGGSSGLGRLLGESWGDLSVSNDERLIITNAHTRLGAVEKMRAPCKADAVRKLRAERLPLGYYPMQCGHAFSQQLEADPYAYEGYRHDGELSGFFNEIADALVDSQKLEALKQKVTLEKANPETFWKSLVIDKMIRLCTQYKQMVQEEPAAAASRAPKSSVAHSSRVASNPSSNNGWFGGISGWFTRPVKLVTAGLAIISALFLYKKYAGRSATASAR